MTQMQLFAPALAPIHKFWEQPLKACFPKIYLSNLYIEYYKFCQQCEDYFEIAKATGLN